MAGIQAASLSASGFDAADASVCVILSCECPSGGVISCTATCPVDGYKRVLRKALVAQAVSIADLEQSLRDRLAQVASETLGINISSQPSSDPDYQVVTLQVDYPYRSVTPFLSNTPWAISVTASKTVMVTG